MHYQHGQDHFYPPTNLDLRRPEYPLLPPEQASPELWLDGNVGSHHRPSAVDFKTDMSPVINHLTTATTTSSATFPSSLPAYLHRPSSMQTSLADHRRPLAVDGSVRRVCSTGDLDVQAWLTHFLASSVVSHLLGTQFRIIMLLNSDQTN